jgi:hypothetical protein
MSKDKTYLGDGVYGEWEDGTMVKLTTEDGISATNTIFLEPEVMEALIAWWTAGAP